jgi:hypothetical protein
MGNDKQGSIHSASEGGVLGKHPDPDPFQFLVGPSTADEFNTARLRLIPIACFRIDDVRFKFDSSFPLPDVKAEMTSFSDLRKNDPNVTGAPLSIFGHADPSFQGNFELGSTTAHSGDDYNKTLSGRRAIAIYAMLIREPSFWNTLFSNHLGGDVWGEDSIRIMLDQTDPPANAAPSPSNSSQSSSDSARNSRVRDIANDSGQRQQLFLKYMNLLCGDLRLDKSTDFLARGAGPDQKGDVQGCGRFNPMLLFSAEDEARFKQAFAKKDDPTLRDERDENNRINRRVMILIFRKGSQVLPTKWPCPTFKEGTAGCKKRFFSNGDVRRSTHTPGADHKFVDSHDTFACRFYQRISDGSPCTQLIPPVPGLLEVILDSNNDFAVDKNEPVATFVRMGIWDHAFDPDNGNLFNTAPENKNFVGSDSVGKEARRFYFRVTDQFARTQSEVTVKWRTELAAGGNDDAPASQDITLSKTADPGVFVSRAVFLVAEDTDKSQATDSGLLAGNPDQGQRSSGQSNHRLRKVTVDDSHTLLDAKLVAEYRSVIGGKPSIATVPLFNRAPEERLRIKVHLVNVKNVAGVHGSGALKPADKTARVNAMRAAYARCGIVLDIDEILLDPPADCINWATRFPTSPEAIGADPSVETSAFLNNNLVPSANQSSIIKLIRARPDFNANDVYLVYVNKIWKNPIPAAPGGPGKLLALGPGGTSFPDSFSAAGSLGRSFAFVGLQVTNFMADAHEMTHITTNLRNSAGGHFHLAVNIDDPPGNIDGRNLMQRHVLIANGNISDSKRLWDENFTNSNISPAVIPPQISAIRASRFVSPL